MFFLKNHKKKKQKAKKEKTLFFCFEKLQYFFTYFSLC